MPPASARVLVAEPARLQLQLIDMLLSPGGFDLVMVQSGREALDYLKSTTPECALLALDLPDLAGDEICGKIRRVSRLARLPVVLIAPQAGQFGLSDDARTRARRVGADLVLPRPLGDKNIRERIRSLVDARGVPARESAEAPVTEEHLADPGDPTVGTDARADGTEEALRGDPGRSPAPDGTADASHPGTASAASEAPAPDPQPSGPSAGGGNPLRHEVEALRLENRQLRRKLAEKQAALDSGVNPPLQRRIDELERRNRALIEAIEDLKNGRDEGRGGGLFGRRK